MAKVIHVKGNADHRDLLKLVNKRPYIIADWYGEIKEVIRKDVKVIVLDSFNTRRSIGPLKRLIDSNFLIRKSFHRHPINYEIEEVIIFSDMDLVIDFADEVIEVNNGNKV